MPIAASVTVFESICLWKGTRVIASKGKEITNWKLHQLFLYCSCGIVAGMVGGLLGLGGGFILGPLFLELGIPPQVCINESVISIRLIKLKPQQLLKMKDENKTRLINLTALLCCR